MNYKAIPVAPMLKGLAAETDYATQPKGTFPRGTNLLLNKRGALDVCDGSQLVHAFNGAIQSGRGKDMANFLFQPTGVPSYYLSIMKALDIPIGPPQNLTAAAGSGGSLAAGTYFYKVTALDGANGETNVSNEVSAVVGASGKVTLTWNFVPNAQSYNVYRGTSSGAETILAGKGLPAPQVAFGNLTVSYVDDGTATLVTSSLGFAQTTKASFPGSTLCTIVLGSGSTAGMAPGQIFTTSGESNGAFNGNWSVLSIIDPGTFQEFSIKYCRQWTPPSSALFTRCR